MSGLGLGILGGVVAGLLFTILIAAVNGLKYLREIRDLLQERGSE